MEGNSRNHVFVVVVLITIYNILVRKPHRPSWFLNRPSILVEWKFEVVGVCGRTKTGEPGLKPLE